MKKIKRIYFHKNKLLALYPLKKTWYMYPSTSSGYGETVSWDCQSQFYHWI